MQNINFWCVCNYLQLTRSFSFPFLFFPFPLDGGDNSGGSGGGGDDDPVNIHAANVYN